MEDQEAKRNKGKEKLRGDEECYNEEEVCIPKRIEYIYFLGTDNYNVHRYLYLNGTGSLLNSMVINQSLIMMHPNVKFTLEVVKKQEHANEVIKKRKQELSPSRYFRQQVSSGMTIYTKYDMDIFLSLCVSFHSRRVGEIYETPLYMSTSMEHFPPQQQQQQQQPPPQQTIERPRSPVAVERIVTRGRPRGRPRGSRARGSARGISKQRQTSQPVINETKQAEQPARGKKRGRPPGPSKLRSIDSSRGKAKPTGLNLGRVITRGGMLTVEPSGPPRDVLGRPIIVPSYTYTQGIMDLSFVQQQQQQQQQQSNSTQTTQQQQQPSTQTTQQQSNSTQTTQQQSDEDDWINEEMHKNSPDSSQN